MASLSNIIKEIIFDIFPGINLLITNSGIEKRINELAIKRYEVNSNDNLEEIVSKLKKLNDKELKRKETIENKAKSILIIITLSGTLLIGTMDILYHSCSVNLLVYILIIGILYLIVSVLKILPIVRTIEFNDLYFDDLYAIVECKDENSNIIRITLDEKSIGENINELVKSININQLYLLKSSNNLSSAVSSIKISFGLIFLFLLLTSISLFLH